MEKLFDFEFQTSFWISRPVAFTHHALKNVDQSIYPLHRKSKYFGWNPKWYSSCRFRHSVLSHWNQMGPFHYHRVFLAIYRTKRSQFQCLARLLKSPSLVSPRGEVRASNVVRIFIVWYLVQAFTTLCSLTLNDLTLGNKLLRKKLRMFKSWLSSCLKTLTYWKKSLFFRKSYQSCGKSAHL